MNETENTTAECVETMSSYDTFYTELETEDSYAICEHCKYIYNADMYTSCPAFHNS